jgi:hypothetical protein
MLFLETTSIRPKKFITLIPLLIMATVIVPVVFIGPALKNMQGAQYILLLPILFAVFFWFMLNKVEVLITNDGITYKTLFTSKEVLWNDVVRTYVRYQQQGKSGSHYWFFETGDRTLKFSSGYFSRKSLRIIAEAVVAKCKHADIQDTIHKWAEGQFPWHFL